MSDVIEFSPDRETNRLQEPWQMSLDDFRREYETLMQSVAAKEKKGKLDTASQPYEPVTPVEAELLDKDWKAFSRARGFTEEDIVEYERWMKVSGQTDNLTGAVNDPWRRGRANWAENLWNKHREHAQAEGKIVPKY